MRPTPVILVNNFPGPGMGGGEVQLLPVVRALIASGARVQVDAVPGSGFAERCAAAGAEVVSVPMRGRQLPAAVRVIRRTVLSAAEGLPEGQRPVLMGTGYLTNLLVRQAARGIDVAVVNQVAVIPGASAVDGGSSVGAALRAAVDRATAGRVDRFVAVSSAVREGLVARGVDARRVSVILNGVDFEALGAVEPASTPGLSEELVVAVVARLTPVKGVEYLVRAVPSVPGATFVIVGTGRQEPRLREVAVAGGAGERIRFLGAVESAAAVLARADVVVMPSLSEAFGLVAAEAMALGKPVVASWVGGLGEVVEDGVTGVLVAPGRPDELAAALRGLLGDPARARAMGEAGRGRARELFSADRMAAEYVALVGELGRTEG